MAHTPPQSAMRLRERNRRVHSLGGVFYDLNYRVRKQIVELTLWANISGSRKDREDIQHASESWTFQLSREKKILKIGAWVTELLHFLCSYSNFDFAQPSMKKRGKKGEISKNAKIDDAILLITPLFLNRFSNFFSSESCYAKLSDEKRIFKIGSETWELWLKNVWAKSKLE